MNKIQIKNVSLKYDDGKKLFSAINDINIDIKDGEIISIIGPSGCGKSTLISLLSGLKFPTSGQILIDNKEIQGTGKDRGVVFQHYSLFPWMNIKKNLTFGIKQVALNKNKKEIVEVAEEYLEKVGLEEFADKYPSQLSGGMQQRVAIARAFAMDSEILLMDEPFGAVDSKNRAILQDLLLELWNKGEKKKVVVIVTHDIDEAIFLADKVIVMSSNPGSVKEEIKIDFKRPRDREKIFQSEEYAKIRKRIVSLFYDQVSKNIGGLEVVI